MAPYYPQRALLTLLLVLIITCRTTSAVGRDYALVLPVFRPHFRFLLRFLASLETHVYDRHEVDYLVVASNAAEAEDWVKVQADSFASLGVCCLQVTDLDKLLNRFGAPRPENMGGMTTQGLKKFYGSRALTTDGAAAVLFVDAEAAFLRPASVRSVFTGWLERRVVLYDRTTGPPFMDVLPNALSIVSPGREFVDFGNGADRLNLWGVQQWIVERDVLAAFFEHVEQMHNGTPLSICWAAVHPMFTVLALNFFIFLHPYRFPHYRFVNFEDILPVYLQGNLARDYLMAHRTQRFYGTGLECYLGRL